MKKIAIAFLILFMLISAFSLAAAESEKIDSSTAHIGVMTGSTGEAYAKKSYPDARLESYADIMDAVAALAADKLDAVLTSDVSAFHMVSKNPLLMIDGGRLTDEAVSVILTKDDTELMEQINAILDELERDGTLANMKERWMGTLNPIKADIPKIDGPVLKVGLTATRAPFSYKESDGTIVGFAPELAYRIGEKLGYQIEFVATDFGAMLPALQSGKTDAIIDLMVYTEERAKAVSFSNAYYTSGQVILRKNPGSVLEQSFWGGLVNSFQSNLISENRWVTIVNGLGITVLIAVLAFFLATLIGFLICYINMSQNRLLNCLGGIYLMLMRGIPMVVLLMVTYYIIFAKVAIHPVLVAIIAFGMNSGGAISQILRSAIATVDKGQIEAVRSMGFSKFGAFMNVTFPQAVRIGMTGYQAEFVSLFKGTAIVGYIAIVDLTKAGDLIRSATFDAFFPLIAVAIVYLITIALILQLFHFIIRMTDKRKRTSRV